MLSDRERETLREVQDRFVTEDPGFAAAFKTIGPRDSSFSLQWAYTRPSWAYTTVMIVATALGVLMVVAGAPGSALVFAALATAVFVLRCHRDPTGRQESWSPHSDPG